MKKRGKKNLRWSFQSLATSHSGGLESRKQCPVSPLSVVVKEISLQRKPYFEQSLVNWYTWVNKIITNRVKKVRQEKCAWILPYCRFLTLGWYEDALDNGAYEARPVPCLTTWVGERPCHISPIKEWLNFIMWTMDLGTGQLIRFRSKQLKTFLKAGKLSLDVTRVIELHTSL